MCYIMYHGNIMHNDKEIQNESKATKKGIQKMLAINPVTQLQVFTAVTLIISPASDCSRNSYKTSPTPLWCTWRRSSSTTKAWSNVNTKWLFWSQWGFIHVYWKAVATLKTDVELTYYDSVSVNTEKWSQ